MNPMQALSRFLPLLCLPPARLDYLLIRQGAVEFNSGFRHRFHESSRAFGLAALIRAEYRFEW